MHEWQEMLARLSKNAPFSWAASGIGSLDKTVPDPLSGGTCRWRVVELTDSLALLEEGRAMQHCVRTYQHACTKGATTIFSLRRSLSKEPTLRRLLTIEVNRERHVIVQVRGKCNQSPGAMRGNRRMRLALDVLREWAQAQRLRITCSL